MNSINNKYREYICICYSPEMNSIITRSLYRHKVRECIRLGYIPGKWNNKYVVKDPYLNNKKIKRLYRKGKLARLYI